MLIRMPDGISQLSLAGVLHLPGDGGAFEVPDEHGPELVRVHGGVRVYSATAQAEPASIEPPAPEEAAPAAEKRNGKKK